MTYQSGKRSQELLARAKAVIPGGVNSPVRAFRQVGGDPLFIASGSGAQITDADGRDYIDYVGSWGPMILGHAPSIITDAVAAALKSGTSFGAPTEREVELAELLVQLVPSMDQVRLVSSGTEATMSAIRLARAATGRDVIVKFNGCYHGHSDSLLVKAGSGVATLGIAGSKGVPETLAAMTLSVEFNDIDILERSIKACGTDKVAAVILEPVPGNMGLILPEPKYLKQVRELCTRYGIVMICDEVMTGFRVALGGAQSRFDFKPDLTTLGKVIGGGLPVGAFGGRKDIMELLAPVGPVYQAGTLSGNPLAVSAGLATLRWLRDNDPYPALEETGAYLAQSLGQLGRDLKIPLTTASCGSMFGFFFSEKPIRNYTEALSTDVERFKKFFHGMLEEGVYLAPSAFEAGFVGIQHTRRVIDDTLSAAERVLRRI